MTGGGEIAWWEYVLYGYLAVILATLLVMSIGHRLHLRQCTSCPAAERALAGWHPGWRLYGTSHRATEADRDVIAVFYQAPPTVCEPTPYRLVAVDRASGAATELPDDPDLSYHIRGRK